MVTNIGVQRIINSVKEQYIKELNEEYFGNANNTIKSVLHHLQTNWCKIMTSEPQTPPKILSGMGTHRDPHHHIWSATQQRLRTTAIRMQPTTRTPIPPAFNPIRLLQTELAEQRKQVAEVMMQNATLMAALYQGWWRRRR